MLFMILSYVLEGYTFFKFNVFCWSIECLQLEQNVYLKYVYVVILLSISGGVIRWFFLFYFFHVFEVCNHICCVAI